MIKKIFKQFLYRYVFPYGGLLLVKLISLSYRVKIVNPENETHALETINSLIYACWHQRFFPGIDFFSKRKPITIMISQSRDGEFMSKIVDILGWHSVRGSSSKGGREALQEIKKLALLGYRVGHIVDGPTGPFAYVKSGLLNIAQVAEIPIVPTIISGQKKWTFNSWDKFMVPKPFSRVIIRFGKGIHVEHGLSDDEFENKRQMVEQIMKKMYEDTDRIWADPERIKEIYS
jgi:lysophospholipid acyltransferase (LPLAT)-like uncharacterized protein